MFLHKFGILVSLSILKSACSSSYNFDTIDRDIFNQNKEWSPIITSGPTVLVSSNITTVYDQNGEPVQVQPANNNVGIGRKEQFSFQ